MEKPNAETEALFRALLPADPRVVPGKMFGHACAFVGGHMFFGTFAQTLIARVGPDRAPELACAEGLSLFEPLPGRTWREYVRLDPRVVDADEARTLALDALEFTAALPPKPARIKAARGASARRGAAREAR